MSNYCYNIIIIQDNNILAISSLETKQEKISAESVDINHLIDDLHNVFAQEIDSKKLKLIFKKDFENGKSTILTERTKLNQIQTNLLTNAIKVTSQGQIE